MVPLTELEELLTLCLDIDRSVRNRAATAVAQ
jgi:hypothetical protein